MRRELTDVWLRGVRPPASGRLEIWDTAVPRLVFRMMPSGAASWGVRMRTADGKRTRANVGSWPAMGLSEARRLARARIVAIEGGGDPVADKQKVVAERKARASLPTVADRLTAWQAERARLRSWSARYQSETARLCAVEIIPRLGKRVLAEVARADWMSLISATQQRSRSVGASLYTAVSSFLGYAETRGWIDAMPLPRKGKATIAPPVPSRERVLTDDELAAIWRAADAFKAKSRAFVHLLIMTAAREMEAADVAVGELDLDAGLWVIPGTRTKNHLGITLPLPPSVTAELATLLPAQADPPPDWRLLGARAGGGLRGFSKLKERLDASAGVHQWRWHDLRRTARTGMTRLGVSRDHAEAALNHVSDRSALERRYDRHDFSAEVSTALGRWQAHVAGLVAAAPATGAANNTMVLNLRRTNVVPMRRHTLAPAG